MLMIAKNGGQSMQARITNKVLALYRLSFMRIVRQTLIVIFPLVLIGTVAKMLLKTCFEQDGFIYNIAFLDFLPPELLRLIQFVLTSISQLSVNLVGVYAVYMAAKFTAQRYQRDGKIAGITGIFALLIIAYRYGKTPATMPLNFYRHLLNGDSLLLVLLLGYAVGQVYRWLTPAKEGTNTNSLPALQDRSFTAMRPILLILGVAVVFSVFLNTNTIYQAWSTSYSSLVTVAQDHRHLWLTMLASSALTLMDWLGLGVPYTYAATTAGDSFTANLNYALAHGSAWNVPYKYLGSTLYNSFANFGGDGLVLALLVAILITSNGSTLHRVARWTAIPTLFNFSYATMVGLPIILNPILLLPFIFLPVFNILVASLAIAIHLIPSTPYPVLQGTPGPLIAFLGTNGNWRILAFTIILLLVDIALYIPFVRMTLLVEGRLMQAEEKDVVSHA